MIARPVRSIVVLVLSLAASAACRQDAPAPPPVPSAPARASGGAARPPAPAPAAGALPPMPGEPAGAPVTDLVQRLAALGGSGELRLPAGTYVLVAQAEQDTGCAPCTDVNWSAIHPPISVGLRVKGKGLRIVGEGSDRTILRTRAGYGVLFDGCEDCAVAGVTITGGRRDGSDQAMDGAVVVRESSVEVVDCVIADNVGDEASVQQAFAGISGIVVREGGNASVRRTRIVRSSGDGVAVLRGGAATLTDVLIDGVDRAQGLTVGGGRGVGIRVATGGSVAADGVLVRRHAGGFAVFGASRLDVRESVVEESTAWGLLAQAGEDGSPELRGDSLIFHRIASCGLAVGEGVRASLSHLRFVLAAQGGAGAGPCAAAALDVAPGVVVEDAVAWLTGGPAGQPGDADVGAFRAATDEMAARLAARPATGASSFTGGPAAR